MATSGTINGTLTVRDILTVSLRLLGVRGKGQEPTADDANVAIPLLNGMLKTWQAEGCNLWRQIQDTAAFSVGVSTVALDPRVLDVMEARYVESATFERTLGRWEWGDYVTLPNKIASGLPTIFVLDKQRTAINMTVWPVPSVATTIRYTAARVIDDTNDLNDEVDLPQEWLETVYFNLAERLIAIYGIDALLPTVAQRVTARAQQLYAKMLDFDRPASVFMKPWGAR